MRKKIGLKNVVVAMLVLIVGFCINVSSETKVHAASIQCPMPINEVFPDYGLANAVKRHLGKQSVTDLISQRELDGVQRLNGNNCNIKCIKGIQYLTNLKQLYLSYNQISDISMLTSLTQIELLSLMQNKLKDIDPLVNLTKLRYLYVGNNQLRDLWALEGLENLEYVEAEEQICVNNPIVYKPKLVIPNTIKDMIGKPITPNFISDNGEYVNTVVVWELPMYKTEVSYKFKEILNIGKDHVLFSGVVIQPLELETSADEKGTSINQALPESNLAEALKKGLRKQDSTEARPQNELDKAKEFRDANRGNAMFMQLKKSLFM
ncbi:Internalin B precursor [Listeria ivanovii subsp. londoniensis]|uniref:Internalin N-terminal domain-containing protein n=2 Tax=Listeria ivanovii TaxID=1638 RepID=A0ABS1G111_LISIV|nr:internalin N-terminal domain-containing protein [Listeria ivanovii]MBC2254029.1 internalin [Listeria ivanovii]MBK1960485.1 internalin N-terminal domain-containing protein [Listeria ivanovii subsp. londoniensis]MBK2003008.1 internalin N-terminal domain-containing protein [Listeria ivanovii subsp. londoniensis]MBM5719451.1 internalin [Listeria ivanovii]SDX40568.1 Leucine Rich repeat-containing protein [Listeria ivanovii]